MAKLCEEKQHLLEEKEEMKLKIDSLQATNDKYLGEMQKLKKNMTTNAGSSKSKPQADEFEASHGAAKKIEASMPRIAGRYAELEEVCVKLVGLIKKRMEGLISESVAQGAKTPEHFQENCDEIADEIHENLEIIHTNLTQNKEMLSQLVETIEKLSIAIENQNKSGQGKPPAAEAKALGIIQQEFNNCKEKLKETKGKLKAEAERLVVALKEVDKLQEENEGLESENEEMRGSLEEKEQTILEFKKRVDQLVEKLETMRLENKKLFQEKTEIALTVESLEERSVQLNKNLSSLDEDASLRMRDLETKVIQEKLKSDSLSRDLATLGTPTDL